MGDSLELVGVMGMKGCIESRTERARADILPGERSATRVRVTFQPSAVYPSATAIAGQSHAEPPLVLAPPSRSGPQQRP